MKDLFGNQIEDKPVVVNIYADEVQPKECPYTKEKWFYIGIVVENLEHPLLDDIIDERYCNNFDKDSPYYAKNDRIIHWSEINDADTKNISKRWLEYILNPEKSRKKFFAYILGVNNSKLNKEEFNTNNEFNSKYNRFFRSAILYALETFYPNKQIIVQNIFHEEGQQKHHQYFPWHCIYRMERDKQNISFMCHKITFLSKDHKEEKKSNLIQLCDAFLGVCTSIIHGIESSKSSEYREELVALFLPLLQRMIEEPGNINSSYAHANRIIIRFFPKKKTKPDEITRLLNQFYIERKLYWVEQKSKQLSFHF